MERDNEDSVPTSRHQTGERGQMTSEPDATPKAASQPPWPSACLRPSVFQRSVCSAEPWSKGLMPFSTASGFW